MYQYIFCKILCIGNKTKNITHKLKDEITSERGIVHTGNLLDLKFLLLIIISFEKYAELRIEVLPR